MNVIDRTQAVLLLGRMLDAIASVTRDATGLAAANLRAAIGSLRADAAADIEAGAVGDALANCFDLARQAGATLDEMARVRSAAEAEAPKGIPATAIVNAAIRFALIQEALITSDTDFASRDDVDRVLDRMDTAFDAAETVAADSRDTATYRALVALHAAVAHDLSVRSRPLPRIVKFSFPNRRPALVLANFLYGDASRTDELIAENKPVHPAFMPQAVRVLSD